MIYFANVICGNHCGFRIITPFERNMSVSIVCYTTSKDINLDSKIHLKPEPSTVVFDNDIRKRFFFRRERGEYKSINYTNANFAARHKRN